MDPTSQVFPFEKIKEVIASTPMFANPDFSKEFIMYVYGSKHSIATMLTQKNEDKKGKHPIAFRSITLKEYEKKYNFIEKQAFNIVKGLKKI